MPVTLAPHERPSAPGPGAADPRRWLVLAIMSLGTLIVFLDLTVVNTALPTIARDLSATTSQLQWVVDSYVLVLAGLLILAGSIGDRFGRRRFMTAGLVLFLAGSMTGAFAGSVAVLISGRAIQGLGAAFVLPATLSIVTNSFDRRERGKAIAIWTAVGGMGIGFGPAIGGYLVDRYDWSAAFWIHVPIILAALLGQTVVPESRDARHVGLDVPGAITATLGISTLVFGIIEGTEQGWTSPVILGSFGVAAILLAGFVAVERRAAHPMLPLRFFRQREVTGSVLMIAMMFFAGPATFFFLTQFFQVVQGRDPFEAGLLVLPNAGAIVIAAGLAPRLSAWIGLRAVAVLSAAIMALSMIGFTQVQAGWSATTEIALILVLGFGFGLGMPALTDSIMASVPVEDAGVGSAVNDVSRELGSALGIAVLGTFINSLYQANLDRRLVGQVPDEVAHAAKEGIGVLAAAAPSLPAGVADRAVGIANGAFVDAMNQGFWVSAAVMAASALVAALLLPRRARAAQAAREDEIDSDDWPALVAALGDPDPDALVATA